MRYEIGTKIKKYRKMHNLSQTAFAALIGVSNSRVSNWEQGVNRPDVDKLSAICKTLEISADDLLDIRFGKSGFTNLEKTVIAQYRKKPELHAAVHILLEVDSSRQIIS